MQELNEHRQQQQARVKDQIEGMKAKYARTFSGPDGEAVLRDILLACRDQFDKDPYQNAFNSGKRYIGDQIKAMVEPPSKTKQPEQAKR